MSAATPANPANPANPASPASPANAANPFASPRLRALRDGAVVAGLLFFVYLFVVVAPQSATVGFDALSYWVYSIADPYKLVHGTMGSFVYSPVAARLFQLDSLIPFWQFVWLWSAVLLATAIWLGGRRWLWVLAFPPVALELYHGNVQLLMAAAIALGFRYPAAWSFILLTKVTPGIGLIWFAVRREWRPLGIALGVTAVLVAVSVAVDRQLWVDWIDDSLLKTGSPLNQFSIAIPLLIRLPLAALLVAWGGWSGRPWTVPVAATLALPILWPTGFAILAALWPIAQRRPEIEPRLGRPIHEPAHGAPATA